MGTFPAVFGDRGAYRNPGRGDLYQSAGWVRAGAVRQADPPHAFAARKNAVMKRVALLASRMLLVGLCAAPTAAAPGFFRQDSAAETPATPLVQPTVQTTTDAGPADLESRFSAVLDARSMLWASVFVILLALLRLKPLFCTRNFDALILVAMAFAVAGRPEVGRLPFDPSGHSVQWWSYLVLSVAAGYWLLRGFHVLGAREIRPADPNVASGGLLVLVLAALLVGLRQSQVESTPQARDAVVGGMYMAQTGKLPYGFVPGASASPLVYAVQSCADRIAPVSSANVGGLPAELRWSNHQEWSGSDWWESADLRPMRLVNGALLILTLGALVALGKKYGSPNLGLALAAIFALFPGALAGFGRPDQMLPAALLAWTLVFAGMPYVGGLLSGWTLVLAGVAAPWAWLAAPALLAYSMRRGLRWVGTFTGLLGGGILVLLALTAWTRPLMPRLDGALAQAALPVQYGATLDDDGSVVLSTLSPPHEPPAATFKSALWKRLLDAEALTLADADAAVKLPAGVAPESIEFKNIVGSGRALEKLNEHYAAAAARLPESSRLWVALRTVLESTWCAAPVPQPADQESRVAAAQVEKLPGAWALWASAHPQSDAVWTILRRSAKVVAGVLALIVAIALLRTRLADSGRFLGAATVVVAATQLASESGAADNLVWLLVGACALVAAAVRNPSPPAAAPAVLPPAPRPMSRITVEP